MDFEIENPYLKFQEQRSPFHIDLIGLRSIIIITFAYTVQGYTDKYYRRKKFQSPGKPTLPYELYKTELLN